jgi:hypothetical protein
MRHLALAAGGRAGLAVEVTPPLSCILLAVGLSVRARPARRSPASTARLQPVGRLRRCTRRGSGRGAASWCHARQCGTSSSAAGISVATVPFRGRAGKGGEIDVIRLQPVRDEKSREVRLWPDSEELAHALAAPVWGRFGTFVGHPLVRAEVIWTVDARSVVIVGRRGERRFEESAE